MGSFMICTPRQILLYWSNWAFGTQRREEKFVRGFGGETWRKEKTGKTWAWMGIYSEMNLRDMRWEGLDWFQLAQKAGRCEDGNEPSSTVKCVSLASWTRTLLCGFSRLCNVKSQDVGTMAKKARGRSDYAPFRGITQTCGFDLWQE